MSDRYWIKRGDSTTGPFSSSQIREMAADKTLKPWDLVSRDQKSWIRAEAVKGLCPQEEPTAPALTVPKSEPFGNPAPKSDPVHATVFVRNRTAIGHSRSTLRYYVLWNLLGLLLTALLIICGFVISRSYEIYDTVSSQTWPAFSDYVGQAQLEADKTFKNETVRLVGLVLLGLVALAGSLLFLLQRTYSQVTFTCDNDGAITCSLVRKCWFLPYFWTRRQIEQSDELVKRVARPNLESFPTRLFEILDVVLKCVFAFLAFGLLICVVAAIWMVVAKPSLVWWIVLLVAFLLLLNAMWWTTPRLDLIRCGSKVSLWLLSHNGRRKLYLFNRFIADYYGTDEVIARGDPFELTAIVEAYEKVTSTPHRTLPDRLGYFEEFMFWSL